MRKLTFQVAVAFFAFLALLAGLVPAAEPGAAGKKLRSSSAGKDLEADKLKARAANRKLYNGVYQASLLQEPKDAKKAFAAAQKKMEKANPRDAGDAAIGQALFQRGYLAMETKDYKGAIELFEDLVKRFPEHAYADDALYQIGYIYQHKLKDYDKAAAAYDRVAKTRAYRSRENAPKVQLMNAQMAAQQGRVKDAMTNLDDARLMAQKQRAERKQTLVPSYYEQQASRLKSFVARNSSGSGGKDQALTLYLKGENQLRQGKVRQAESNFNKIQKKYARSKLADDAAFGLAECRRRALKLDAASKLYAEFLEKHPRSEYAPLAKFRLAEIKRVAGDTEAAGKLYKAALDDISRMVAEGLKKKPPISRDEISPEIRRVLELSRDRMMEMRRARMSR